VSQARPRSGVQSSAARTSFEQRVRQGWEIVIQSAKDMVVDNGTSWAAAIAYYALLSAIPLLLLVASAASLFVDAQWAVERITNMLGDFVPRTEGTIEDTVNGAIAARGQVGLISLITLLWTGTRVFDALIRAMNVTFNVDDDYSPLQRLAIEVVMLLTVGAFFMLAVASGLLIDPAWELARGVPADDGLVMTLLTWIVRATLLFLAFYLIYRFVPRRRSDDRALVCGAAVATVLLLVVSAIFGYFIGQSGTYNLLYGPLAVVAIIIVWVGIAAQIMVLGGEIVSHVQEIAIEGRSAEEVGRRHAERSPRQRTIDAEVPSAGEIRQKFGG
jgi:membrane protein